MGTEAIDYRLMSRRTLGFIGGTGPEGRGLALRFALAGHSIVIGSRDAGRASEAADSLLEKAPNSNVVGAANLQATDDAEIVFIVVPFGAMSATLEDLETPLTGKTVVSVVAPLEFAGGRPAAIRVPEGSAAEMARSILPESTVVAAFQTISARDLLRAPHPVDSDVIVCADDDVAKQAVMTLAGEIPGLRAVDGGGLGNSRYVEDFTALLLNINRIYKAHSAVRIAGI